MDNANTNQPDTLPAPVLPPPAPPTKWERERDAFYRLLPDLLRTHGEQYVAIHEGRVVASGTKRADAVMHAYKELGYVPIFCGLVTTRTIPPIRIPSPRMVRR